MSNIDNSSADSTSYSYPIQNFTIRQGQTDPLVYLQRADSENAPKDIINDSDFVGSIVIKNPQNETYKSYALNFEQGDSETIVWVYVPTEFTDNLNPLPNRPVQCFYDIWESTDGINPSGSGVLGGSVYVHERITRNTKVGVGDVNTKS